MGDYRSFGPLDEPRERVGEAYWPDYLLALNITWSGVNNRLPPEKLAPGLVADGVNTRMRNGDIEPRLGVVKPGWLNQCVGKQILPMGVKLYGAGVFSDPQSREWVLIAADGNIYRCCEGNYRFTLPLPPGVKVLGDCSLIQAFNRVVCFRGKYLAPLILPDIDTGFIDVIPQYNPATAYKAAVQAIEQPADEMAYGPFQTVTGITLTGNLATVVTAEEHGYVTGADVTIKGANQPQYNGRWNITVIDPVTFTFEWYAIPGTPVTPTSITSSGTTATVTLAAHGLTSGQTVLIAGATQPVYNGIYIITVTTADTFTYVFAGSGTSPATGTITYSLYVIPVSPATGTIKVSNMALYWQALGSLLAVTSLKLMRQTPASLGRQVIGGGTLDTLTSSGTTATATTLTAHGLATGNIVAIAGATPSAYNGTYAVTVTGANTFTYVFAGGTSPATGTITAYSTTVAVATIAENGLSTGNTVTVAGATPSAYNGTFGITVLSPSTFSYLLPSDPGADATGTIQIYTSIQKTAVAVLTGHGFSTGQIVPMAGATPGAYNGSYAITVLDANTFTYAMNSAPGTDATGTITAQAASVLAGQSPDSNPEAWNQIYNVLPNADDALFINNLLLVPTAYTPGDNGYDSTSEYTKKDYIVATDILDPVHFTFTNEFRINQGDDSEIETLTEYDQNTVIVTKGRRWGILGNLQQNVANITYTPMGGNYGACALRSAIAAGKNVYFPASSRGVVSLNQTQQGLVQSVDVALSTDIAKWTGRICWPLADKMRLGWWNDCLYWAAPLDGGTMTTSGGGTLTGVNTALMVYDFRTQQWVGLDTGSEFCVKEFFKAQYRGQERLFFIGENGWVNLVEEATSGDQVADLTQAGGLGWAEIPMDTTIRGHLFGQPGPKRFPLVELGLAMWAATLTVTVGTGGLHTTRAAIVNKAFNRTQYLKPFDAAPYDVTNVNGDFSKPNRGDYTVKLGDATQPNLLAGVNLQAGLWIQPLTAGHSYTLELSGATAFSSLNLECAYGYLKSDGSGTTFFTETIIAGKIVSGVPFTFTPQAVNNAPAGYALAIAIFSIHPVTSQSLTDTSGVYCGAGLNGAQYQEVFLRPSTKTLQGAYDLIRIQNATGRMKIKAVTPAATKGDRRMGLML